MRYIITITIFLFSITLFFGCSNVKSNSGDTQNSYDTLYKPLYASHFVILTNADTTILRVLNPWQGATDIHYDYKFVEPDPQRIITMSSSHSAFFEALGLGAQIVGVSGPQYINSPALQNLPDVGYDNSLHYETIVGLKPKLMTTYEIAGQNSSSKQKLLSLNIPIVYIADYLENSPLAKAEWVVAFGAMSNTMERASTIFAKVQSNYNTLKSEIGSYLAQGVKRKKVMLNSPYNDVWYLPGDRSYIVELTRDAGGDYVASGVDDNISRATSIEVAYSLLSKADIWLNPSAHVNSKRDLSSTSAILANVKIPIFNNTKRGGTKGGSDFWESGVLRPDIALKDIASMLYPTLLKEHELYYYKEIK